MRRRKKVLLVEPEYKNKYPPLGLMKIATYHKVLGDEVAFFKGKSAAIRDRGWDHIYISTLFTFSWASTVDTIKFYARGDSPVTVGGILASLMPDQLELATGIRPKVGPLLDRIEVTTHAPQLFPGLDSIRDEIDRWGLDALPPDYGIFDGVEVPYRALLNDSYLLRTSRGCSRGCGFCAVPTLEPRFVERIRLKPLVDHIDRSWGQKQNLVLLDDNVLLSAKVDEILAEIRDVGFAQGARLHKRKRSVDFNQGLDMRLLNKQVLEKLARIALRPLRIALDNIRYQTEYEQILLHAHDAGFAEISTYVLYNYDDKPEELYQRLKVACLLNSKLGMRIYSFPMKYIPCDAQDRSYLGRHWTRRQIRGVQCILNSSHGISPRDDRFFEEAFGRNTGEFMRIIRMPEDYIIKRSDPEYQERIKHWVACVDGMSASEGREAFQAIAGGKGTICATGSTARVREFLVHYGEEVSFARR